MELLNCQALFLVNTMSSLTPPFDEKTSHVMHLPSDYSSCLAHECKHSAAPRVSARVSAEDPHAVRHRRLRLCSAYSLNDQRNLCTLLNHMSIPPGPRYPIMPAASCHAHLGECVGHDAAPQGRCLEGGQAVGADFGLDVRPEGDAVEFCQHAAGGPTTSHQQRQGPVRKVHSCKMVPAWVLTSQEQPLWHGW